MRIKKVTVESFGKLKNKNIEFSDGINVIKGENESGKSTLSRFIRFMLYGFTSRNTDINKNDKKKYLPWDGSNCKGSMEVVTENGSYTVRREQAARALVREATGKYSFRDRSDISDMFEGAGLGIAHPLGAGHGLDYWSSRGNSKEIFAEIISAEAAHPGSLKAIKDYFPKTYQVYQDMMKARKRR